MLHRLALVLLFLVCAIQPRCCEGATATPAHSGRAFGAPRAPSHPGGPNAPAGASQEVQVTGPLVCAVQHGIRWREAAWSAEQCRARTQDYIDAGQRWGFPPAQLLAMSIEESDLRARAQRPDGRALDCGLMAVRCVLGRHGRCTNWPVRGLTSAQLLEPRRNIQAGAQILAQLHGGSMASYNGDHTHSDRYPRKVGAIMAALGGVEVRVKGARLRKLVRQIVGAVEAERKT